MSERALEGKGVGGVGISTLSNASAAVTASEIATWGSRWVTIATLTTAALGEHKKRIS